MSGQKQPQCSVLNLVLLDFFSQQLYIQPKCKLLAFLYSIKYQEGAQPFCMKCKGASVHREPIWDFITWWG